MIEKSVKIQKNWYNFNIGLKDLTKQTVQMNKKR